ncbi:MAG: TldD/PmbA family protein [Lachnospiraceae bacterium]|nr:TldD/PmbA family protein [Lachnospiraceae bacterium]
MKVKESLFLKEKKPLLKKLLDELLARYEYASILASDSIGKIYNVSKTGTNIREDANLTERGFCIKICDKGETAEYSFNEISEEAIPGILKNIEENLIALDGAIPAGIEAYRIDKLNDERICINESTEYEEDPEELGNEKIIELLTRISEKGRAYDERIINCSASFSYQKYTKMFLSRNKDMTQNVMWSAAWLAVLGSAGEEIKDSYQPMSILGGSEILKNLEATLETACKTTIELFDAQPIEPGEYECICMPDVTGMIVHEAFGHGVEMDMFVKDRALAQQYVGKQVASELITMHDGASTIPEVATFFFDDEGIPAHDTIIIKNGILQTGICDLQSAAHLSTAPTGNGRRESTQRKAYTRMTNTIFEAGSSTVEEMIASVKDGVMLCEASSGMEDPKNWGIQLMVNYAREIKDGKFTGRIFSPIVMTGYVPDLLKSISMISDKMEACGTGYCGKGYKEWVKVSDGGPYIKAKIRLG